MGIIITDGRTALRCKGSLMDLQSVISGLSKLQKTIGPETLMIETVPLPDSPAMVIGIRFRGPLNDFEKVVSGLSEILKSVAIDTVPLPEKFMIGTWPTPEFPRGSSNWLFSIIMK